MKQESLLWYAKMMEFTQDTEDRMKLIQLAYDEWVADWITKAGERIFANIQK